MPPKPVLLDETTRFVIASPARAKTAGEVEERRVAVEDVSAACSAARRESWAVAKVVGLSGFGGMVGWVMGLWSSGFGGDYCRGMTRSAI